MRPTIRLYLSSTKYGLFNPNGKNWKFRFQKFLEDLNKISKFKLNFYDPFQFESSSIDVVDIDKNNIQKCKYFVCYLDKITIGTIMEIMYQYDWNYLKSKKGQIECILIDPSKKNRKHPWIAYHCKNIFDNVEDAAIYIYEHMKTNYRQPEKRNVRRKKESTSLQRRS